MVYQILFRHMWLGFRGNAGHSALFRRSSPSDSIVLLLYVDDMIIIGDDTTSIFLLKILLLEHFEMKNLGQLRSFLGIEIASSPKGYLLSQSNYASEIIKRARLSDTRARGQCSLLFH